MKIKLAGLFCLALLYGACGSECFTCTHENNADNMLEFCEESNVTYTDSEGNVISFSEIEAHYESIGFNCDK